MRLINKLCHKDTIWIIMFGLLFIGPTISYPIVKNYIEVNLINENRERVMMPSFTKSAYNEFPKKYEEYYNDNLPYRDYLIQTNSKVDYFVFQDSPSQDVILGSDDWLFYSSTMRDYKKENLYTEEELASMKANLESMKSELEKRGAELYVFFAPNKSSVYGEDYLPSYILRGDGMTKVEQFVSYLHDNSDINVIYALDTLMEAKKKYPNYHLYLYNDTHWNYLGGYWGSKLLLEDIGVYVKPFDELKVQRTNEYILPWIGLDLVNMMGLTGVIQDDENYVISNYSENDFNYVQEFDLKQGFNRYYRTKSNALDNRKVMFVRDSYGSAMLPYIARCFAEVYSPHHDYYKFEQIEHEKPDIVIFEYVERSNNIKQIFLR